METTRDLRLRLYINERRPMDSRVAVLDNKDVEIGQLVGVQRARVDQVGGTVPALTVVIGAHPDQLGPLVVSLVKP